MSLAFTLTATVPDTVPPVGDAIETVGGAASEVGGTVFETVTVAGDDVFELPAASYATAVSVVDPSATVAEFHVNRYGAEGIVAIVDPLIRRSTRVTPMLSLALTDTLTTPETVPPVGDAIETVGGVVSAVGDEPAATCNAAAALMRPDP